MGMTWTDEQFDTLREQIARWSKEIEAIEAGEPPAIRQTEGGQIINDIEKHLAHLKQNVASNRDILEQNGQPFDA
jgi:hypothetical protein